MAPSRDSTQAMLCDEEKFKSVAEIESDNTPSSFWRRNRSRFFHPITVVIVAIVVSIPLLYFAKTNYWRRPKFDQCGTSAAEARERGCVFETTGFTWLPKECHDGKTEEEFLTYIQEHDLNLYRDANYTDKVSIQEVRLGNGPGFFVRQQYHVTHCQFLLKKLHRAQSSGKMIDGQIMPTHHTEHCIEQTLKLTQTPGWRKDLVQLSYTKFPYCGKVGGYAVGWDKHHGKPAGWTNE